MMAEIPNSGPGVKGPDGEICWRHHPLWLYPDLVSAEAADRIRDKINTKRHIAIPDEFDLVGELKVALGDFQILMEIRETEPDLPDTKRHIEKLVSDIEHLQKILDSMGGYTLKLLCKHGAFRSMRMGLVSHPGSAVQDENSALEHSLDALCIASIAAWSDLEGERPAKTYQSDTAIFLLADVYEKASGGKAYARDYEDTYFMSFLRAALPLFEVDCPPGYTVRRVLADRRNCALSWEDSYRSKNR
ncbi:hypothetical protein [Spiribacter onubensis]|uniref:Uncharacterized protein n=1 Tax=Spiribacter onubensis TaxID=3122420 RepID=A0ABV3S8F9_9GAMM